MTLAPDTRKLLTIGSAILLPGVIAAALMFTVFGGVTHQGPHTNLGWMALIVTMGCLPLGCITLLLGLAKLFGNRNSN
jgi:hypothetical protein